MGDSELRYVCLNFRSVHQGRRERVEHFRRELLRTAAFAQTQAVHDPSRMIGIVAYTKMVEDRIGKARRGPAIGIKTRRTRSGLIRVGESLELTLSETAWTARRPALAERFDTLSAERTIPPGGRSPANPELASDLGLRESRLQVLCG